MQGILTVTSTEKSQAIRQKIVLVLMRSDSVQILMLPSGRMQILTSCNLTHGGEYNFSEIAETKENQALEFW